MRVEELMSSAECCRESDTVRDCARLMRDENIGFVPICDDQGRPTGAVTDRDLVLRVIAEGRAFDEKLAGIMTRDVVACRLGDEASECDRLMREHRKSRIMVVDDQGKVKGVVSLADVADVESDEGVGRTLQEVKSDQPATH